MFLKVPPLKKSAITCSSEQLLFAGFASLRASAAQSFLEYNVKHWNSFPDSCRSEIKADR